MEEDWPLIFQSYDSEMRRVSITGNWKIFYRCCELNNELNEEWDQLNYDIWVRFYVSYFYLHLHISLFFHSLL